ncbi:Rab9 effector protein, partial [Phytophthora palmivora]
MPLVSFEGVKVDLPVNLAGIDFEFTAGSLTIHCRDFTGDIVLSKQPSSRKPFSPSKKRTIDLSASDDDDDEADAKRLRTNFLNEAEQTLLLAQLNDSQSQKVKSKEKKTEAEEGVDAGGVNETANSVDSTTGKKTATRKGKKKAGSQKESESFFSPEPKQSTSRKATPDSNKKRNKTL